MSKTPKEQEPWPSPDVATPKPPVTQTTPDESKEWAEKYGAENPERNIQTKDEKEFSLRRDIEAQEPGVKDTLSVVAWAPEEIVELQSFVEQNPGIDALPLAKLFVDKHPGKSAEAVQQRIFKLRRTDPLSPKHSQVTATDPSKPEPD